MMPPSPPPPLPKLTGQIPENPRAVARQERTGQIAFWMGAVSTALAITGGVLHIVFYGSPFGLKADTMRISIGLLALVGLVGGLLAIALGLLVGKTPRGAQTVWLFFLSVVVLFIVFQITPF